MSTMIDENLKEGGRERERELTNLPPPRLRRE
jgi:hypothetical protein